MKNKVIICLITLVLCLSITGCSNKSSKENQSSIQNKEVYSLTSTDNKLVFYDGSTYEVYYYSNDKIDKVEVPTVFDSESLAKKEYEDRGGKENTDIKYVGNIFINTPSSSYYDNVKDYTQEQLKEFMSSNGYELK